MVKIGAEGAARERRHKEEGVKRLGLRVLLPEASAQRTTALPQTKTLHYAAVDCTSQLCTVGTILNLSGTACERLFFFLFTPISGCCATRKEQKSCVESVEIQKLPSMSNSSSSCCVGATKLIVCNYLSFFVSSSQGGFYLEIQ